MQCQGGDGPGRAYPGRIPLAIQFKTELITADERLANALAARLPVK